MRCQTRKGITKCKDIRLEQDEKLVHCSILHLPITDGSMICRKQLNITAGEYQQLEISAGSYQQLEIKAIDYDLKGKEILL